MKKTENAVESNEVATTETITPEQFNDLAELPQFKKEEKERVPSATYCITQLGELIKKLIKLKLIDPHETEKLNEIRNNVKTKYFNQL